MGCEDRLRGLEEHQGLLRRLQPQRRTEPDVSGNPAPRGRARALWLLVSCWDEAQLLIHPLPLRVSRSEECRSGSVCVSKCRSRWLRYSSKKKYITSVTTNIPTKTDK